MASPRRVSTVGQLGIAEGGSVDRNSFAGKLSPTRENLGIGRRCKKAGGI